MSINALSVISQTDYSVAQPNTSVDENNNSVNVAKTNSGIPEQNLSAISEKSVINTIENANKIMINNNTRAEFSIHEKTKAVMIKIVDTDTNKVIREFPPEKILDLVAKLCEMSGIIVDERR